VIEQISRAVSPDGMYVSELSAEVVDTDPIANLSTVRYGLSVRRASTPRDCPKVRWWDRLRKRRGHRYRKNSIICRQCGQRA
jgi:superfamily II helicase